MATCLAMKQIGYTIAVEIAKANLIHRLRFRGGFGNAGSKRTAWIVRFRRGRAFGNAGNKRPIWIMESRLVGGGAICLALKARVYLFPPRSMASAGPITGSEPVAETFKSFCTSQAMSLRFPERVRRAVTIRSLPARAHGELGRAPRRFRIL